MKKKFVLMMSILVSLFMPFVGINKTTAHAEKIYNMNYALVGSFQDQTYIGTWDYELSSSSSGVFYHSETDHRAEYQIRLKQGDEFRIMWKLNYEDSYSKENSFGYSEVNLSDEVKDYVKGSGTENDAFVVTKNADFRLIVDDEDTENYLPITSRFKIEIVCHPILNIYDHNGNLLDSAEYNVGEITGLPFYNEPSNYRFIGWFYDLEFTKPIPQIFTVGSENANIYLHLVPAEDFTIYIKDDANVLGDNPYIYGWRTFDEGSEMEQPGQQLTKNEDGLYPFVFEAYPSYDRLRLSNGNDLFTIDFDASNLKAGDILCVSELNSEGKYDVVVEEKANETVDNFASKWAEMRKAGGANGICAYLTSTENNVLSELLKEYMSYDEETKAAIRAKSDGDNGVTIGETIDYIMMVSAWAKNILSSSSSELNGVIITSSDNVSNINIIFVLVSVIAISIFFYYRKVKEI